MSGRTPRRESWKEVPADALRGLVLDALDLIDQRQDTHEEEDRDAFTAVRSQNRWIATLVIGAIVQVAVALAIILITAKGG